MNTRDVDLIGCQGQAEVRQWPRTEKRFAVLVGIDEYEDPHFRVLRGASNDALAIGQALSQHAGFPADQVKILVSRQGHSLQPTGENILRELDNALAHVSDEGLFLFFFAGHGKDKRLYAWDAHPGNPDSGSLSIEDLKEKVNRCSVPQVLFLIDACRSEANTRAGEACGGPMTPEFADCFRFDRANCNVEAFATIFATRSGSPAYESEKLCRGYFTLKLEEGLRGGAADHSGAVTLQKLIDYVEQMVPVAVSQNENQNQRPWHQIEGYKADELVVSRVEPGQKRHLRASCSFRWATEGKTACLACQSEVREPVRIPVPSGFFKRIFSNPDPPRRPSCLEKQPHLFSGRPTKGQMDASEKLKAPVAFVHPGTAIPFVLIPKGHFWMGCNANRHENPSHRVDISPFYMGITPVTQEQWHKAMGGDVTFRHVGDKLPVNGISWNEARAFIEELNQKHGGGFRLPSESEWEYACRANSTSPYPWGDRRISPYAWYDGNAEDTVQPVGGRKPNGWGLHDMLGNVWEWCQDHWHATYENAPDDGSPWLSNGCIRVLRGGAFDATERELRSSFRKHKDENERGGPFGVRVALDISTFCGEIPTLEDDTE